MQAGRIDAVKNASNYDNNSDQNQRVMRPQRGPEQRLTKDFGRMFSQVAGKAQTVSEMRSLKTHRRFYLKRLVS